MNEKINITKMDGAKVYSDLVCFIENTNNSKRYVYHTLNETVGAGPNSTVKIYVSKIKQNDPNLDNPITEEDWNVLKGYMGDALKGNSNPEVKYISPNELVEPISVSDRAIAMPTSYDYINKQRGIYAQAIATAEPAPVVPSAPTPETASIVEPVAAPIPETPIQQDVIAPTPNPAPTNTIISEEDLSAPIPGEMQTQAQAPEPIIPAVEPAAPEQIQTANENNAAQPSIQPEPTPVAPIVPDPIPTALEPAPEVPNVQITSDSNTPNLERIDIGEIESRYNEMIASINDLKNKEIEAAKRYNATIELSSMHKEQHANYVQNEQLKEIANEPTPAPTAQIDTTPNPAPAPMGAPTPVGPTVVEPTPVTPENLETNWFDMPNN